MSVTITSSEVWMVFTSFFLSFFFFPRVLPYQLTAPGQCIHEYFIRRTQLEENFSIGAIVSTKFKAKQYEFELI